MSGGTIRTKRRETSRKQPSRSVRRRDRPELQGSLGATIAWTLVTIFGVTVLVFYALLCVPTSAVRNLWDAATRSQIAPSSYLYQTLLTKIHTEDAYFVSPGSLFAGGLVFGRLIPLRFRRARTVLTASLVAAGVYSASAVFSWALDVWMSGGRTDWRGALPGVIGVQLLAIAMATAASAVGTVIGVLWRDWRSRPA